MLDYENLDRRELENLTWLYGFTCPACHGWTTVFVSNRRFDEKLGKLKSVSSKKFPYKFSNALRSARALKERFY